MIVLNEPVEEKIKILEKVLKSDVIRLAIGSEEWDLTEEEEIILLDIIKGIRE